MKSEITIYQILQKLNIALPSNTMDLNWNLKEDLKIDSLQRAMLFFIIKDSLVHNLEIQEAARWKTLGDIDTLFRSVK